MVGVNELCIVPSCKNTGYRLHKLPVEEERGREWLRILGVHGLENKEYRYLRRMTICNIHFDDSQFTSIERLFLNRYTATPSLNPTISCVVPSRCKGSKLPHIIVGEDGSKVLKSNNKLKEIFKISDGAFEKIGCTKASSVQEDSCTPENTMLQNTTMISIKSEPSDAEEVITVLPPEQLMLPQPQFKEEPMDVVDQEIAELPGESSYESTFTTQDEAILCNRCKKYFPDQELFEKHFMLEGEKTCSFCSISFTSKNNMLRHVRLHHSEQRHNPKCYRCKKFFLTVSERDEHLKLCMNRCIVKEVQRLLCNVCGRKFTFKYLLSSHMQEKHTFLFKNPNTVCNQEVLTSRMFYFKLKSKLSKYPNRCFVVFCPSCEVDIAYDEYFTSHFEQCFLKPNFKCPFCNIRKENIHTDMEFHFDRHLALTNTSLSECNECNVAFFNCINYFAHNKKVHIDGSGDYDRRGTLNKPPEISTLENVPTLSIPETVPRTIKLIEPVHLNKGKCYSKNVLENVRSVNETIANKEIVKSEHVGNSDTYFCVKCDDEIPKSQMARHIALHLYKCPFCTQVFDSAKYIRRHMGLTPNADTYLYEFLANETFYERYKNSLFSRRKRVVYLVERPKVIDYIEENQCKVCTLKFQFHCQLLRHQISIRHDLDVIQCGVCKSRFSSKFTYDYHLTLHSEEMVYCGMCRVNLSTIDKFMRHLNSYIHAEDNTFGIECKLCYDMKLNEDKLHKHNDKYHRDSKYWCRICDTKYETLLLLDAHRACDHNILKFSCKKCKVQFSNKQFENLHAVYCRT